MEDLRVLTQNLGFNDAAEGIESSLRDHDKDTLCIINEELTAELKASDKYKNFHAWLQKHGARYPSVDYPVVFGKRGELMGLAAARDIPPLKAFLFIP